MGVSSIPFMRAGYRRFLPEGWAMPSEDRDLRDEGNPNGSFQLPPDTPLAANRWYQRWLDGDPEAWEWLVQTFTPMVYQFCYHFTHSPMLAEEYTQEIFIRLFQNLEKLGHHTNLKYWIMRTTYNYCIDAYRRQRYERRFLRRLWLEAREWWHASLYAQEHTLLSRDVRRALRRALRAMPDDLQAVLIMREFMELSYEEIAQALGIPVGTVKSRLNRARNLLARRLQAECPALVSAETRSETPEAVIGMPSAFVEE
jgi:RNA polymerase sigma-70 factor (ECF subfamily)